MKLKKALSAFYGIRPTEGCIAQFEGPHTASVIHSSKRLSYRNNVKHKNSIHFR